jgi:hypothetical protein
MRKGRYLVDEASSEIIPISKSDSCVFVPHLLLLTRHLNSYRVHLDECGVI